ncbi:hypothetical protein GII33_02470 [Gordonia pseudamarae]|jgi:hypothetical protein|uniref:ESX secretion-associated protein EspG n=1 Tax=Gordonia pseudamarae TaxID=2831662 RepID=A0ABX6IDK8_9ACTN|nr:MULTISPECIES: hypothetical protein [Gordonia]MBD0022297.1 hypothetical protein [Gordonia sp. (in: high G+C Gram-positive bacteria)]QHN25002.1 hypothetical protein GII33_02470 [Gordonia pseudamarae]QHN33937.1 hypothetical protein GII31_02465 [Gordonia pseudamarae]
MSLISLAAAPPSGRSRPLIIDDTDYATTVIGQGSSPPWTDIASLAGYFGQVQALLNADATWVDVQRWQRAQLDSRPDIVTDMGARSRAGYALRTLLGDPELVQQLVKAVATVADTTRRRLILRVPSPGTWLAWAHEVAGTPIEEIDADNADGASMYVAEWLGQLGTLPVAAVVLDAVETPDGLTEALAEYTSITNVAQHFGWSVVMRYTDRVDTGTDTTIGILPAEFWSGGSAVPETDIVLTRIPAQANPEVVLDKLKHLA